MLPNPCDTGNVNIGMQGLVTTQGCGTMSGHLRLGSSTCWAFGHQGIQCLAEYLPLMTVSLTHLRAELLVFK
jgi:hypothetical protein